jgi:hypothetical protein
MVVKGYYTLINTKHQGGTRNIKLRTHLITQSMKRLLFLISLLLLISVNCIDLKEDCQYTNTGYVTICNKQSQGIWVDVSKANTATSGEVWLSPGQRTQYTVSSGVVIVVYSDTTKLMWCPSIIKVKTCEVYPMTIYN